MEDSRHRQCAWWRLFYGIVFKGVMMMKRKAKQATIAVWALMIVCVVLLSIWPAIHYITAASLWAWWLAVGIYSVAFGVGWFKRNQRLGRFILSITVALAVVFGLFVLLVALFAEAGVVRYLVGLMALLEIIAGIIWYSTVYERRNKLENRHWDD